MLRQETYALLSGTVALLAILSVMMAVTNRLDWSGRRDRGADAMGVLACLSYPVLWWTERGWAAKKSAKSFATAANSLGGIRP